MQPVRAHPGTVLLAAALATALVVANLGFAASPALAQDDAPQTSETETTTEFIEIRPEELSLEQLAEVEIGDLIPDPNLSPGVDQVFATSPEYDEAIETYLQQLQLIAEARGSLGTAEESLVELEARRDATRARLTSRRRDRRILVHELDRIENHLRAMAVVEYVSTGSTEAHDNLQGIEPNALVEANRSIQLIEEASEVQVENRSVLQRSLSGLDADQSRDETTLAQIAQTVTSTQNDIEDWTLALFQSATLIPELEAAVRDNRRLAFIPELEFDVVVLDAYNAAAIASEVIHPGCGVQWWMLAGIGRVETRHGTFNRLPEPSVVGADGQVLPEIIGIPLNGESETAVITDTDGGLLDRDPVFDRAVGPMQFIPSTWAGNGLDSDGDGVADPHNLYDAALSAAHYLCRTAGSVNTVEGLRRGYFAYNHSDVYVDTVYRFAIGYSEYELG